jgi:hypothetical protein
LTGPGVKYDLGVLTDDISPMPDGQGGVWLLLFNYNASQFSLMRLLANGSIKPETLIPTYIRTMTPDGKGGLFFTNDDSPSKMFHMSGEGTLDVVGTFNRTDEPPAAGPSDSVWAMAGDRRLLKIAKGQPNQSIATDVFAIVGDGAEGVWFVTPTLVGHKPADGPIATWPINGTFPYMEMVTGQLKADGAGGVWMRVVRAGEYFFEHVTATGTVDRSFGAGPLAYDYAPSGEGLWAPQRRVSFINHVFIPPAQD